MRLRTARNHHKRALQRRVYKEGFAYHQARVARMKAALDRGDTTYERMRDKLMNSGYFRRRGRYLCGGGRKARPYDRRASGGACVSAQGSAHLCRSAAYPIPLAGSYGSVRPQHAALAHRAPQGLPGAVPTLSRGVGATEGTGRPSGGSANRPWRRSVRVRPMTVHFVFLCKMVDGVHRPLPYALCGTYTKNATTKGEEVTCVRCRKSRAWESTVENNTAALALELHSAMPSDTHRKGTVS